jgi:hypothetical protein
MYLGNQAIAHLAKLLLGHALKQHVVALQTFVESAVQADGKGFAVILARHMLTK